MIRSIKLIKKKINTLYAKYKTKKLEDLLILDDNQDNPPLNGNKYLIISLVLLFVGTFLLDLYRWSR